ncbi:hypothetical protein ACO0QE_004618 [Hanseniaspora vineae]
MSSPVILSEFNSTGDVVGYVTVELNKQRLACKNLASNQILSTLYFDSASTINDQNALLQVSVLKFFQYNGVEICLVGLNNGELWLYSFNSNEILNKLNTSSSFQINDVQVITLNNKQYLYCIDLNNTLYQFDLDTFELNSKWKLDEYLEDVVKFQVLDSQNILLCSHTVALLNLETLQVEMTFPGHVTQIQDIQMVPNTTYFITTAVTDRFLNIYDYSDGTTKLVLNCSENVSKLSQIGNDLITCVTAAGELESFIKPFSNTDSASADLNTHSNKRKKRQQISKKSSLKLKFQQSSKPLKISNCKNISDHSVQILWLENVSVPFSQIIDINENIDYSSSNNTIVIAPKIVKTGSKHYQTSDLASNVSYKEGNALVTSGDNYTNIETTLSNVLNNINEEELEVSLQDQLQLHSDKYGKSSLSSTTSHKKKKKDKKTVIGTLTVILQQALKSNDHSLLDQVLGGTLDEQVIKMTIYRLSPPLSVVLLERLAERIARNSKSFQASSSSGNNSSSSILEVWCKWCLIIHGAYLTSVPNLMNSLSTLHSTMKKRASLLNKLNIIEERLDSVLQRNDLYKKKERSNGYFVRGDQEYDGYEYEEDVYGEEDGNTAAFEEDVEYVEELDDAGLLDIDGEEGEDDENEDDEENEGHDSAHLEQETGDFDIDKELVQEDAYSDEEL